MILCCDCPFALGQFVKILFWKRKFSINTCKDGYSLLLASSSSGTKKCANDAGDDITAEERARCHNILPAHQNVVNCDTRSCAERTGMPVGDVVQMIIDSHRKCPEFVNAEVCEKMDHAMKYDILHSLKKQYSTIVPMLKHIDIDAICAEKKKQQEQQQQQQEKEEEEAPQQQQE